MIGLEEIPNTAPGKYEIVKRIAVGGMAEIFLARTRGIEGFEKYVVLKKLNEVRAESVRAIRMFLDEARLAAQLHHHNIAQVHDMGQQDGEYFIAMEYLHGKDVRAMFKTCRKQQAPLPLQHALTIAAGVAAGLQYAHTKVSPTGVALDIVHRDVSPSNIFVTYEGGVKLVDFGIARAAERSVETQEGALKGKVRYMSPEQVRGQTIDHRSDIFSLGIVLYEMTAMTRLFGTKHDSDFMVMERIVRGTITPPSENYPDYPPALEAIVMRALAKERDDRYRSAREMLTDIEEFAAQAQVALSSSALAGFMQELFGEPREPWHTLDEVTEDSTSVGSYVVTLVSDDIRLVSTSGKLDNRGLDTGQGEPVVPPSRISASMPSLDMLTPSALTALPRAGRAAEPSGEFGFLPDSIDLVGQPGESGQMPWSALPPGASSVMLGDIKPDRRYMKWGLAVMALVGLAFVLYAALGSSGDDLESGSRPAAAQPLVPAAIQDREGQENQAEQSVGSASDRDDRGGDRDELADDSPAGASPDDGDAVASDETTDLDESDTTAAPEEQTEEQIEEPTEESGGELQESERETATGTARRKGRKIRRSKSRKRRDGPRRSGRDSDDSSGSGLLDREW